MSRKDVYLETFGCQMNELDSELVAGALKALGYRFVPEPDSAQVVLYNTCSVREHAEQKVWSRLGELAKRKLEEPGLVVGVLGCMAERDGIDLVKRMPVVDVLCGPGELDKLPGLLDNAVRTRESLLAQDLTEEDDLERAATTSARQVALQGSSSRRSATLAAASDTLEMLDLSRAISPIDSTTADGSADPNAQSGPRSAYVRITRGCNKFCTYCVVPFTRGAEVHRPPEHIIDECKRLADAGVIEITLLGQTVNHYRFEHDAAVRVDGVLQPQKGRSYAASASQSQHRRDPFAGANVTTFADLLREIHDQVPAIQRLRFVTSYPRDFGDDVLEVIRHHPRICRYLHVPAQSGSDRLLKLMNRGYSVAEYLEFLDRAKHYLHQPDIGRPLMVSGDFIVGFPTETDDDFAASMDLVRRARYKNAFIFKYSPRPGTVAIDKFEDDVPEPVKRRRNNELLALQNSISDQVSRELVGMRFDVYAQGLSRKTLKHSGMTQGDMRKAGTVALTIGGRSASATLAPIQDAPSNEVVQLSCRTDGDVIVFVEAPIAKVRDLIGRVISVQVDRAEGLALHASLA